MIIIIHVATRTMPNLMRKNLQKGMRILTSFWHQGVEKSAKIISWSLHLISSNLKDNFARIKHAHHLN